MIIGKPKLNIKEAMQNRTDSAKFVEVSDEAFVTTATIKKTNKLTKAQ